MSPSPPPRHFQFVDAMRGYAILGVILFHAVQLVPDAYPPFPAVKFITSFGADGVQLFFVISAFSLFWSLKNRQFTDRRPLPAFYVRRIFRVAPLFWLGILFYLTYPDAWRDQFAPNGVGATQIVATALFLHGWYPTSINSVVPGGWSIAAEMMFYLTLPLMFRFIRSIGIAMVIAMLSSGAAAVLSPMLVNLLSRHFPPAWADLMGHFVFYSFPMQFLAFCWGIVLYFLVAEGVSSRWRRTTALLLCALPFVYGPSYLLLSILFTLLAWWLAVHPVPILVHRLVRFIGVVSYSMYLWHFFVLDQLALLMVQTVHLTTSNRHLTGTLYLAILYMAVSLVTVLVASVSYYLIERPFIKFGGWVIASMKWGSAPIKPISAAPELS